MSKSILPLLFLLLLGRQASGQVQISFETPGWWTMGVGENVATLVARLPSPEYYWVRFGGLQDTSRALMNLEIDGNVFQDIGNTITAFQAGACVLVEAQAIGVKRFDGNAKRAGAYLRIDSSKFINSQVLDWSLAAQSGMIPLVVFNAPKHVRIFFDRWDGAGLMQPVDFKFLVYVDGTLLPGSFHANSNVDVYGSRVSILLNSWPPVAPPGWWRFFGRTIVQD